ncbi:MAG: methyltransferase domain-containing protein, partial [Acidimicrobiales bacterium]
ARLWASCIGGAAQERVYCHAIEKTGLQVGELRESPYRFISEQALGATKTYGVKSISLLATKR